MKNPFKKKKDEPKKLTKEEAQKLADAIMEELTKRLSK
jgi:hypothetical protein